MEVIGINVSKPCDGILVIRHEPYIDKDRKFLTCEVCKTEYGFSGAVEEFLKVIRNR